MSERDGLDDWVERIELAISLLLQVSILAVAVNAFVSGKWSTSFSGAVVLLLTFVPAMLERKFRVRLPVEVTTFVCVFLFASYVLGEVSDFYEQVWWWDLLLHGASAFVTGLIGFMVVYGFYVTNRMQIAPIYFAIISFTCAVTVGTIWEIFEYLMDITFGLNMQRSGLHDTMTDLIVNGFGALAAALVGYYYVRREDRQIGRHLIQRIYDRRQSTDK